MYRTVWWQMSAESAGAGWQGVGTYPVPLPGHSGICRMHQNASLRRSSHTQVESLYFLVWYVGHGHEEEEEEEGVKSPKTEHHHAQKGRRDAIASN